KLVQQVVAHVAREIRDELDALDPRGVVNLGQKIGKAKASAVAQVVFVTVDGLTQERDLFASFAGELANLRGDGLRMPALLRAAYLGNDAIGATLIAA